LVKVFLGRVVLGNGVVDVEFSPLQELALEVFHGILGVPDVIIRDHDETAMLALSVHASLWSVLLKQGGQLFVVHV